MSPPAARDLPPPPGVTLVEGGADVACTPGTPTRSRSASSTRATRRHHRAPGPAHRARPRLVVRLRPGHGPGPALQRAGRRPVGPRRGMRYNPAKLLARPVRPGDRGRGRLGAAGLRPRRRRRLARRRRLRETATARRTSRAASSSTTASTGGTTPPRRPVAETRHLRGARPEPHRPAPRRPRGAARHVCRAGPPRRRRPPHRLGVTAVELLPVHAFTASRSWSGAG